MRIFVPTIFCLAVSAITAAAVPNFTGEWKMNAAKSDFGNVPAPDILTRSITHNEPEIEIKTHQKGARGESTTELKYSTDGKPAVNKINGSEAKGTARWDGASLIIESWREIQGMEIKSREAWSLSEDGKTLTIRNHISVPQQGDFDTTLVLEKQ
jgi:hypothetical protein